MPTRFIRSIALRVATIIAAGALLFLTVYSLILYQQTFQNKTQEMTHSLSQLIVTVESSAAIACYLDNIEIANDVVQGLARNDMVSGVSISSLSGLNVTTGNMVANEEIGLQLYPVLSPLKDSKNIGKIIVNPNQELIEKYAQKAAQDQVISMVVHTFLVITLVIILVYWQLTKPINFVARQLGTIQPGSKKLINYPAGHQKNEIGKLVTDTNHLLKTVRKTIRKEQTLRKQVEFLERRFRLIFENASGGIALINLQGKLLLHNPSFEKLVGKASIQDLKNTQNHNISEIFAQNIAVKDILNKISILNSPIAIDLDLDLNGQHQPRCLHSLFSAVENEDGEILVEVICYDISIRAHREKQIQLEANHDPLTNLLNRRGGTIQLEKLLSKCQVERRQFAVLMVDLDKFKPINDTFGHECGDFVLRTIAQRIKDIVRQNDLVIRLGGDEFLIVLTEGHSQLNTQLVVEKLLLQLEQDILIEGEQFVRIGGSIGIATYPEDGENIKTLMKQADSAMYRVKSNGRNGYCFVGKSPAFNP